MKPSETEARSAAEMMLRRLKTRSIDFFLVNPGTDFLSMVEALAELSESGHEDFAPLPLLVTHENVAVSMANGASLVTGRPQAVMVHTNVGTANAINALTNAARDRVPVILMAGKSPATQTGMHGSRSFPIHWAQEMFDQAGMVRELVKWEYELRYPEQAHEVIDRAIDVATASPQGPVYLTLPREVLAAVAGGASSSRSAARAPIAHPDPTDVARSRTGSRRRKIR